jgi:hypothetical protein
MAGELERPDPAQLRISDDDRHRVAEVLREAAGEGRLDLDELDQRLEATYAAKTYGDLVPITVDLPAMPGHAPVAAQPSAVHREIQPASATYESSLAIMGDCTRRGQWLVPAKHTAFAMMGSVTLDLREATFAAPEVTLYANALMAGIEVVVDAQTLVIVEGVGIMGDFSQARDRVDAELGLGSPVVRVKGLALMGSVSVVRKGPPSTGLKRLRGRRPG